MALTGDVTIANPSANPPDDFGMVVQLKSASTTLKTNRHKQSIFK